MILADTHVVVWLAFDQVRISHGRPGPQSTTRARMRKAWQSPISLCWNWPHLRVRVASGWTSALNPSSTKSSLVSLFCQSRAEHALAPWIFLRTIRRIQPIASLGPLRWSRGCPCLLLTVTFAGQERFTRFGRNVDFDSQDEASTAQNLLCKRVGKHSSVVSCLYQRPPTIDGNYLTGDKIRRREIRHCFRNIFAGTGAMQRNALNVIFIRRFPWELNGPRRHTVH